MKSYISLMVSLMLILGCGGGGGDDTTTVVKPLPTNSSSQCDGDVTFNTSVPDSSSESSDSGDVSVDVPGIINPAVSKALAQASFQGLKVVSLQKLDHVTIIGTCDATININVDSGNSSAVPVE